MVGNVGMVQMKTIHKLLWVIAVIASMAFGALLGHRFAFQGVLTDSKIAYCHLKYNNDKLTPQTREYLKDHLYWEIAVFLPKSYLIGWDFDFGPVNEQLLNGIDGRKDAVSAQETYSRALLKLDSRKNKIPNQSS